MKNETFVIAEIGINHNGSLKIAKDLILMAKAAGCNAVKFQKRDINTVYTEEELNKPRKSPIIKGRMFAFCLGEDDDEEDDEAATGAGQIFGSSL